MEDYTPDGPAWVFEEATQLIQQGVVKVDHFENIYRLPKKFEGSPNWRKARGDYNVVGSGQSSLEGLKSILGYYRDNLGWTKVIFINMRSEPVIYANTFSYAPRNPHNLNENIEINGLSISDVEKLQSVLVNVVREKVGHSSNGFVYHKDTYALVPEDRQDYEVSEPCDPKNIMSVVDAYNLVSAQFPSVEVKFLRLPVNDERVPNLEDFDRLSRYLKAEVKHDKTGVHFNCQMGKGRTTTGMVLACLVSSKIIGHKIERSPDSPTVNKEGTLENGDFSIIRNLCVALNGDQMKSEMDCVIDACDHMQNLRKCIWETKVEQDKELKRADVEAGKRRAAFWAKLGVNFIERYFYLIIFNHYCTLEVTKGHDDMFVEGFADWCGKNQSLIDILGTRSEGPLSKFNWA